MSSAGSRIPGAGMARARSSCPPRSRWIWHPSASRGGSTRCPPTSRQPATPASNGSAAMRTIRRTACPTSEPRCSRRSAQRRSARGGVGRLDLRHAYRCPADHRLQVSCRRHGCQGTGDREVAVGSGSWQLGTGDREVAVGSGSPHFVASFVGHFVDFVESTGLSGWSKLPIKSEIKSGFKWVLRTYTLSPHFVSTLCRIRFVSTLCPHALSKADDETGGVSQTRRRGQTVPTLSRALSVTLSTSSKAQGKLTRRREAAKICNRRCRRFSQMVVW